MTKRDRVKKNKIVKSSNTIGKIHKHGNKILHKPGIMEQLLFDKQDKRKRRQLFIAAKKDITKKHEISNVKNLIEQGRCNRSNLILP